LAAQQRGLLGLLKTGNLDASCEDGYLRSVQGSAQLATVQAIVAWWRTQIVETYAPLTSRLLSRLGRLPAVAKQLSAQPDLSAFRDRQAGQFLDLCRLDLDPVVAAMADFESAVLAAGSGRRQGPRLTAWPCDPNDALRAVLTGAELPQPCADTYLTEVSADLPGYFRFIPRSQASPDQ
jgi:hypothetical protein